MNVFLRAYKIESVLSACELVVFKFFGFNNLDNQYQVSLASLKTLTKLKNPLKNSFPQSLLRHTGSACHCKICSEIYRQNRLGEKSIP
jgi:hypothetical protein